MLGRTVFFAAVTSAWGWSSPHRDVAFLHADAAAVPEEGVGMAVPPVSTTMKCTINLTLQYMVIFTALGICRSYLDFQGTKYDDSHVQKALKHASETVFYAPMACLLFVGFRMRVLQLTKGDGNPQDYVQFAMQAVAYSILANTLLVLVIPVFTKYVMSDEKEVELDAKTGELDMEAANPFENPLLATVFTVIRYASFLALYVGFGTVVYGLFTFEPPAGVWDGPVPEVSPAVFCTCLLAGAFFTCYMGLAIARTYSQFTEQNTSKFEEAMLGGADTLALAPMFCVLFLGARMRALQMDPISGNPQSWAQNCFYTCTYALFAQCIIAVVVPLTLNGKVKKTVTRDGKEVALPEGDRVVEVSQPTLAWVLTAARWVIMLSIYVAAIAVVCSVFTIEHPKGAEYTPAVSPTMQCVINFAFQYFLIYILVWAFYTFEQLSGYTNDFMKTVKDSVENAKATVQFAPMLCVLFIATRMRALQITDQQGAPQGYVQDGMYLATWAVLIQFLMCLVMPFLTGVKYEVEPLAGDDKPIDHDKENFKGNYYGALCVTIVRYLALIFLLGGITAVITGVFLMTPENANGAGSMRSQVPLVGEHLPEVPTPPTATDVPGVKDGMQATGEGIGSGVNTVHGATGEVTGAVEGAGEAAAGAVGAK